MKTKFFLIVLLFPILLSAQKSLYKRWEFGIAGGMMNGNASTTSTSYTFEAKNGFEAGIVGKYYFNPNLALAAEMNFDRRGFAMHAYNYGLQAFDTSYYICWSCYYESNIDYQSFYLSLPVYLSYMSEFGDIGILFKAGMFYSLLLEAYQDGTEEMYIDAVEGLPFASIGFEPGYYRNYFVGRTSKTVNTFDAGALLGIGLQYSLHKNLSVFTDASVRLGFVRYFESPEMINVQFKSSSLRLGLLYNFYSRRAKEE